MKGQDIREAYERMSPPKDAKERMMRNIMKKTDKRRVSTARPASYSRWTAIPAALALVAILAVGGWMLWPKATPDPLLDLAPPIGSTEGFLFIEPKDYAAHFAGIDQRYQEILVTYAQAIDEKWSEDQWTGAGLNAELYSEAGYAGYSLMDLDGNGVFELLICAGNEIYEIYGIFEGGASKLLSRTDVRVSIQLCEENIIRAIENCGRFGGTYYSMLRLGNDGLGALAMVSQEIVFVTAEGDWYAGPYEKDAVPVTEAEANAALKKYVDAVLPVTTFSGAERQESDDVVPPGFAFIVSKYVQAYNEKWTAQQYSNNDLSYALHGMDIFNEYGYALMDLNGDGINELLITDGDIIYDLYVLMEDGGAGHILSAGERMRYFLCDDNVIGYRGSGGAALISIEYDRLLPNGDLEFISSLYFDTDTWYKSEGSADKMVKITEDEARHIQDFFVSLKIPYYSFLREGFMVEEVPADPETYADMLREKIAKDPGVEDMYVFLVDVTGDGNSELLLGTEDSFGHVYTMTNGKVDYMLSYGTDEGFTLCEDGVLMYHLESDPFYQCTFISVRDGKPTTVEELLYDRDAGSWYRDLGREKEYLTEEEMQQIIDSYGKLSLTAVTVREYLDGVLD